MSEIQFNLDAELQIASLEGFLEHLRSAVTGFTWPRVTGFASPLPNTAKLKASPESDLAAFLEQVPGRCRNPDEVTIGFGRLSRISWGQRSDGTFFFSVSFSPEAALFADPADNVRALTHVARRLLERGVRMSGAVDRLGDEESCVPFVPLAKTRRPLIIATADEVADECDRPDEFWSAGWTIETFGDLRLLTRCQDVVRKPDVLRETQDHQWQMARAAKPGLTAYGSPVVTEEERPIYEDGEPRLQPVGRNRATGEVEYSCVLAEGDHLRGFEIYYLRSLVQNQRMQDGTPVTSVRVVFLEPWMAESEKRPLLDNGIHVFYEDVESGELVEVTS